MSAMPDEIECAHRVREAMLQALLAAWEDAGMRGLCGEGRFEAAVGALRSVDLRAVLAGLHAGGRGG